MRALLVTPSVFNPKVPRTGDSSRHCLIRTWLAATTKLDMGTGSGVCAVFAAKYARRVRGGRHQPRRGSLRRRQCPCLNGVERDIDVRRGIIRARAR